jgi:hypothetical protein
VQASALSAETQPWPLQAFRPLQELVAEAHSLLPLQLLMPAHLTPSAAAGVGVNPMAPAANIEAAAAARTKPVVFRIAVIEEAPFHGNGSISSHLEESSTLIGVDKWKSRLCDEFARVCHGLVTIGNLAGGAGDA